MKFIWYLVYNVDIHIYGRFYVNIWQNNCKLKSVDILKMNLILIMPFFKYLESSNFWLWDVEVFFIVPAPSMTIGKTCLCSESPFNSYCSSPEKIDALQKLHLLAATIGQKIIDFFKSLCSLDGCKEVYMMLVKFGPHDSLILKWFRYIIRLCYFIKELT